MALSKNDDEQLHIFVCVAADASDNNSFLFSLFHSSISLSLSLSLCLSFTLSHRHTLFHLCRSYSLFHILSLSLFSHTFVHVKYLFALSLHRSSVSNSILLPLKMFPAIFNRNLANSIFTKICVYKEQMSRRLV